MLRWRGLGVSHESLASKFGRSAGFLARVEQLADYKLRRELGISRAGPGVEAAGAEPVLRTPGWDAGDCLWVPE